MKITTFHILILLSIMECSISISYIFKSIKKNTFYHHIILHSLCICTIIFAVFAYVYDPFWGVFGFSSGLMHICIGVKDEKKYDSRWNSNWIYGPFEQYSLGISYLMMGIAFCCDENFLN